MSTELSTVKVLVDARVLEGATELGIDVQGVMAEALEERVAATRVLPVSTTVSDDNEPAGILVSIPISPRTGHPL